MSAWTKILSAFWKGLVDHWPLGRKGFPGAAGLGHRGEAAAAEYLRRSGWTVLSRGTRTRFSELDIVALEGKTIVFVEVKTRTVDAPMPGLEAVDRHKQKRLVRAALCYLKRHRLLEHRARFDVISLQWPSSERRPTITHVRNAFEPPEPGQFYA